MPFKKSKKNKKQVRPGKGPRDWTIMGPPPYQANTRVNKKFRYQLSWAPNSNVNVWTFTPSKFAFLQVIASTTVVGIGLYEAARIKMINLYAAPTGDGSVVDITFSFPGAALGIQGSDVTRSAQTFGSTKGAHIQYRPSPLQQAGQWQNVTSSVSNAWFVINTWSSNATSTAPIAITLDLDLQLQMTTDTRTTGNAITLTTATISDMYYLALDNVASGGSVSNLWKPDRSLNTTI